MHAVKHKGMQLEKIDKKRFARRSSNLEIGKHQRWNPLLWLQFLAFVLRNYFAAIQAEQENGSGAQKKRGYSKIQKQRIAGELVFVVLLQLLIYGLTGGNWWAYFWAGPAAYLFTFAILMMYIITNHTIHSVNAAHEVDDPLLTTITLEVHPLLNKLHLNFAFHTEHHLFPSLNSNYYPMVGKILKEKYPYKYNYIKLGDVWRKLWEMYLHEVVIKKAYWKG